MTLLRINTYKTLTQSAGIIQNSQAQIQLKALAESGWGEYTGCGRSANTASDNQYQVTMVSTHTPVNPNFQQTNC